MTFTRVRVTLSDQDLALLDQECLDGHAASRSAAVQHAVRLLRESRLTDGYAEAFTGWVDEDTWGAASDDGAI